MSAGLEVIRLQVVRDGVALLDVEELVVAPAAVVVVTGASGAGKTLLAATLAGRTAETSGGARLAGSTLSGSPSRRRRLGMAATVADGGRIAGCTVGEALRLAGSRRAGAALERFPVLARRARVRAELTSGGEQQLLAVACAWCAAPRALVLDAPTTGLADDSAAAVRQIAIDSAADGAAVLWLDQDGGTAPAPPLWRLVAGALTPAQAAGLPSGLA